MAALSDYGYAFDDLELRLFVKSLLEKAGGTVPQFKDNTSGVEWGYAFLKRYEDLLTKHTCQNISRKSAAVSVKATATGLQPLNRPRVIDKLQHADILPYAAHLVSPSVIKHLQSLREGAGKKLGAVARGRRLCVSPGKRISAHDLASAGPSGAKKKKVLVHTWQASPSVSEIGGVSELSDPDSPDAELPQVEADEVPVEDDAAQPEKISVGCYFLVKFHTKKQIVHYVGKVVEEVVGEVGEKEYVVDYLRRKYDDDQGRNMPLANQMHQTNML